MILLRETPKPVFHPILLLRIYPRIGNARFAGSARTNSSNSTRYRKSISQNMMGRIKA